MTGWLVLAYTLSFTLSQKVDTARLAVTHITVVDVVNGKTLPDQTLLISGNRIVATGSSSSLPLPADANVVNGTGKYVIPGLWDMHVHAFWPGMADIYFPELLAYGVTGIRDTWGNLQIADILRSAMINGRRIGPRFVVAGNLVDGPPVVHGGSIPADTPERGRTVVDSLHAAGAAFIKVYSRLSN